MYKENYIIYDYLHRDDVISDNVINSLNEVYDLSYPKPTKSFNDMCEDIKKKAKEEGKENDRNYRLTYCEGKYMWPCDFYYMPHKVLSEIWQNRREAYGIKEYWRESLDSLIDFLFKTPGMNEVYSPTKWSNGEDVRHCVDVPLIKDVIGEDNAKKLKEVLENYQNTYRWGLMDVNQFSCGFLSTPSSNRETVKKAWKDSFGIDIEIPDDSAWINEYEYADKEYNDFIEE